MASNPDYIKMTPEIEAMAEAVAQNSSIDPEDYVRYDVKRGLRDVNGKGVVAGLTEISNIVAKKMVDGKEVSCEGELYYRGINVKDLVNGVLDEGRFGFEETAHLLLLGALPNKLQNDTFQEMLGN
ncbi:MAG: citrate synthase, partial [Oscillospiraceae bacterium]|nr:citrate synthase [Oscillospiraceae bacterium]